MKIFEHTNRLAREKSPYLLQHAHNPVDWFPWGAEAFEKARREEKPIFLSVGYSTCHWCHVMERESFENEEIAKILNAHFVSIKVDREERPDVDRVYMTFVQATTGSGGWPMSVWLTPDLKPFFGGTYFPPDDRYERAGFPMLLLRIADAWKNNREQLVKQSEEVVNALREHSSGAAAQRLDDAGIVPLDDEKTLVAAFEQIARSFDSEQGGFGGAPKFPRPVTLNFLLRVYTRERAFEKSVRGKRALEMTLFTLKKMADGGMHDHLGGGFHRYSVDRFWHIPHFEKMLYDQAQLAISYLESFQITRDPFFEKTARDILDYVRRDMTFEPRGARSARGDFLKTKNENSATNPVSSVLPVAEKSGGFFSAEDADSLFAHGKPEHGEGAFYVWTKVEIDSALAPLGTKAAEIFDRVYGVETRGNAPAGSDPQGEFENKNTLIRRYSDDEAAQIFKKSPDEISRILDECRRVLFEIREKRPRPHLDDKIITAWNGLMISAFARAAQVLDDAAYLKAAARAAQFAKTHLYDFARGTLIRSYREGASDVSGFADDYAFLIQGLLDLYEAGFEIEWLKWARELQEKQDALFFDKKNGGYFSVAENDPHILLRMKEDYDGAEPSPNSVSALNLLRLAQMFDDAALRERVEKTIRAFSEQLRRLPTAMPQMLVALDFASAKAKQIVIAGKADDANTRELLRELNSHFIPNKIVLFADGGAGQQWLGERLEFIKTAAPINGKAAAFVCENFVCKLPATDVQKLRETLAAS